MLCAKHGNKFPTKLVAGFRPAASLTAICHYTRTPATLRTAANVLCARLVGPKERNMQLSYEDQLRVWRLLLRNKLAGKTAPAHPWDRRPTEYAILVPDALAVAEVNAVSDTPITIKHLAAILRRFSHLAPPYASFPSNRRRAYKRDWMQRKRCGQKWEARTSDMGSPKSVHSAL
jgi:hypothetical protein